MRANARLLIIGPPELCSSVSSALPRCSSAAADGLLDGLWTVGHERFEGVVVSLAAGHNTRRAIRSLRRVAPQTRIVVTCAPAEEPLARAALEVGADDYVLEPIHTEHLEAALQISAAPKRVTPPEALPSVQELTQLSDVLRNLRDGPQATLERLATLLQQAFDTTGIALRIDGLAAEAGEPGTPVLEESIRRHDAVVGSIAIGSRRDGSYAARDAARLGDYARLIEAVLGQARERAHWQDLAWRDDLSELRNRRYFDATLDQLIERATADRLRVTVILFDIDDFKTYNDSYGHDTGDALIHEVAELLVRCSREHDVVARYGGDEFVVIMWDAGKPRVPGSQHPAEAMELADRFRLAIGEHNFKCLGAEAPGPLTISGGLACFPWDGKTRAEILRAADAALLAAKRTGKDRIALAGEHSQAPPPDQALPPTTPQPEDE